MLCANVANSAVLPTSAGTVCSAEAMDTLEGKNSQLQDWLNKMTDTKKDESDR